MARIRMLVALVCVFGALGFARAVTLRVLATGDMHGWLQSQNADGQQLGGAAEMLAYWKKHEGYDRKQCLVLCSGDANCGSAISTLLKGDPTVTVMDLMGYDACALGVHEFDYGCERIAAWKDLADFPYLAANIQQANGSAFDLVPPYTIVEKQGVKIGIIGLVSKNLVKLADKADGLKVIPYADALRTVVPQVRKAGAQVVIVAAHVPQTELVALAREIPELNIPLILGGGSHQVALNKVHGTWVISSGMNWQAYARVTLEVTPDAGRAAVQDAQVVWLQGDKPERDEAVAGAITAWQQKMNAMMPTVVATAASTLSRSSDAIYNFVDDCMLGCDPKAQIALTNYGSLRQDLPAGPITIGTVFGIMPFTDSVYRVTLPGGALLAFFHEYGDNKCGMAGLRLQDGQFMLTKTGQPIDVNATYQVLVNNYMYENSDLLQATDPLPTSVFADWRQPLYDWLAKHPTAADHPLDKLVDTEPRMPLQ